MRNRSHRPGDSRSSQLERRLGLPPGAWRRRRLFLLTVQTDELRRLGIPPASRLVVEPGGHAAPGRLVVVRQNGRFRLAKQAELADGTVAAVSPDPGDLPYPLANCTRVGAVVAVLGPEDPGRRSAAASVVRSTAAGIVPAGIRLANRRRLDCLLASANALAERASDIHSPEIFSTYRRIEALGKCLDAVEVARLYDALVTEINRHARRLRRCTGSRRAWPLLVPADFRPASRGFDAAVRRPFGRRLSRKRTTRIAQGVDTDMPEVV